MVAAHAVDVQARLPRAPPDVARADDDGDLGAEVGDTLELGADFLQSGIVEDAVCSAERLAAEHDEHPPVNRLCFHSPFNLRSAAARAAVF